MSIENMAVLADIHGNAAALDAVLEDARILGADRFVNLGDSFYGPLDPAATWRTLRALEAPSVMGNQDRILLEDSADWRDVPAWNAARDALGPDGLAWVAALPATLTLDDVLLCHGTPADDLAYLLEDVASGRPKLRGCRDALARALPQAAGCSLVLAGHSHLQGSVSCDGLTLVNPGSVGLPAYNDDDPPHAMSGGSPHARYAMVRRTPEGWDVEFRAVDYDWEAAARLAMANGRPDWARWLASGVAETPS